MIYVFLGPPGSGKGTQAKIFSERLRIPQLSTGDMLRTAISRGTPTGIRAQEYIQAGKLVPDDVVIALVADRLTEADCREGAILDGFPRTIAQAEALNKILEQQRKAFGGSIYFQVDLARLEARLVGRRTCPKCGAMFHLLSRPPKKAGVCDVCGAALVTRPDDQPEVIRQRMQVYSDQTSPLVDFYRRAGQLFEVDAGDEVTSVTEHLGRIFDQTARAI